MDILLKNRPSQIADERRALFALIDRFSLSIEEYKKEYSSTIEKRDKELKQRNSDKNNTLSTLDKVHSEKQAALKKNADKMLADINQQITSCQNRASNDIRVQEHQLSDFERKEKEDLDIAFRADEAEIRKFRETLKHIQDVYSNVDVLLGKTLMGGSKLKRICEHLEPLKVNISNKTTALEAVEKRRGNDADDLFNKIREITESLPKKVIFNGKRSKCIQKLRTMLAAADAAIAWLENDSHKAQMERRKKSENRCATMRSDCNKNKQQVLERRDSAISTLKDNLVSSQKQYKSNSAKVQEDFKTQYGEQTKYHNAQISVANMKWATELKNCNNRFSAKMEEIYPAQRMNAWLSQFWWHPTSLEYYNKIQFPTLNVMIGVAYVDISDWGQGDTGTVIKKILSRYPLLFGRNREEAEKNYNSARFYLPYSLSIEEGQSLLITYDDKADERAKVMVNSIGMRLLRSVPACQMRFQLFDANGIGAFGRLMSLDPAIGNNPSEPTVKSFAIGDSGQVHSGSADISKQIAETKITMDDLSRQLISYGSIREFNAKNPLSKQIYRPILMMNFPLGLGVGELRTLNSMTADCSKWGFSMVLAQPDRAVKSIKPDIQEALGELSKKLLCIRMTGNSKTLKAVNTESFSEKKASIGIYPIPNGTVMGNIAKEIRTQSVEASRVLIRFTDARGICPERKDWFKQKADNGIVVPIGYLDGGQPFKLQFDDKHVHALVMGNTGSGKTNLLHVLMTNLMLRYSPEEVMIYLIDFKYGLDFRVYTQYNLPNFTTISINNDPEFVLGMLQNLEKEQEYRSSVMGSRYQKISDYNAANPNNRINRIILIIDELYELVKQATDEVQKSILKKIDSFAHQTRAFGIHMVVCGQDLDKIDNFETIKNQCITRLALHCGDDQVKMLMEDAGVARMHTIDTTDQGACVFSLSGGTNPQIEHTTYLGTDQQEKLLNEVSRFYIDKNQITGVKVLLTKVSDNPNHIFQKYVNNGILDEIKYNRLIVGEPMSIERELVLAPSENLWIAGGHSSEKALEAGESILFFSALSLLLAKLKSNNLDIICTNCNDQPMRSIDEEERDLVGQMTAKYKNLFKYSTGGKFAEVLNWLLSELDGRANKTKASSHALWWILIRPEMMNGIDDNSTQIINLKELLQKGPKNNIHTIIWNADPKRAQVLQLGKEPFRDKVCLGMESEDWKIVVGSEPRVAPMDYKALFVSNNTIPFRVYDLPDGKWMNRLFEKLDRYKQ